MIETICGVPMPDRLWLVDMGSGDISWSAERKPDGDDPLEAVEYVRVGAIMADLSQADMQRLMVKFAQAADFTTEQDCAIYDNLQKALSTAQGEGA